MRWRYPVVVEWIKIAPILNILSRKVSICRDYLSLYRSTGDTPRLHEVTISICSWMNKYNFNPQHFKPKSLYMWGYPLALTVFRRHAQTSWWNLFEPELQHAVKVTLKTMLSSKKILYSLRINFIWNSCLNVLRWFDPVILWEYHPKLHPHLYSYRKSNI